MFFVSSFYEACLLKEIINYYYHLLLHFKYSYRVIFCIKNFFYKSAVWLCFLLMSQQTQSIFQLKFIVVRRFEPVWLFHQTGEMEVEAVVSDEMS